MAPVDQANVISFAVSNLWYAVSFLLLSGLAFNYLW
jgi:hypothetical protein